MADGRWQTADGGWRMAVSVVVDIAAATRCPLSSPMFLTVAARRHRTTMVIVATVLA